jgi:tRNA(Ile)-lysidine synthase
MLARMKVPRAEDARQTDMVDGAVAEACAGEQPLFSPGARILVACSGGADSVALSSALAVRAAGSGARFVALGHVDHGLRARSADEAEGVRALAERLSLPFFLSRLTGLAGKLSEMGLEAAAREARYAALVALCGEAGTELIATAHTRSDQAETLLLRLARGAGPGALSGVRRVRSIGQVRVVRPLLGVPRAATERYCERHALPFTRDPHNLDPRRARTRIREELPRLAALLNPRLEEALAGAAALLADEDELLSSLAAQQLDAARVAGGFAAAALRALPPALLRRCLLAAAAEAGLRPERTHLERIGALLRKGSGAVDLPLGRAAVESSVLRFAEASKGAREAAAEALREVAVPGPGRYCWGGAMLEVTQTGADGEGEASGAALPDDAQDALRVDGARAPFPWLLRSPRPGDRFRPGGGREKKVSDLLIDARVPRSLRSSLALLEDARGQLFFVEGLRPGEVARGAPRPGISVRVWRKGRELDPFKNGLTPVKRAGSPRASMHSHRPDEEQR